ncbi:hypothetical protein HETIRDRAFT_434256 [Heterobasidion irregulare TC 32-1]|uniref:RNA polymerase II-associated protein 1 C-terminal domain-containing protein n=1 Tax=Heterobasidion irregulare (strain TC 32-1) TaxID=747525 RepID=W4K9U8_HETIT|nr:uncharacterized protein HETIRDRAFT_434256 [Heterobasidion irregulare TC 32-1]ETW81831.1 hypothetical protein HETIRDRAFT_434256 [Heterobasidion irregulare TC 32-1]
MSHNPRPLIGSVFERNQLSTPAAPSSSKTTATGFPAVQHRSKSAFARNREKNIAGGKVSARLKEPPLVSIASAFTTAPAHAQSPNGADASDDDWLRQVGEENARKVASMTDAEREAEKREIEEKFGSGIGEILKRAKEAREARERDMERDMGSKHVQSSHSRPHPPPSPSPPPILSTASTRPSSRAGINRKLRFADITPNDVHVYESAPSSPRRKPLLALPPPTPEDRDVIMSLGQWTGRMPPKPKDDLDLESAAPESDIVVDTEHERELEPEEGTPEDIRRRFFPSAPAHDPNLAWIESLSAPSRSLSNALGPPTTISPTPFAHSPTDLRFDLTGTLISPSLSAALPTHLGLHHHAEGTHAGYTLDDIFLLTRSSVAGQRTAMVGVLIGIIKGLGQMKRQSAEGLNVLRSKAEDVRGRAVAAGVAAMSEQGSEGARAIELLWECIVGWDEPVFASVDGVELRDEPPPANDLPTEAQLDESQAHNSKNADALASLPVDFVLQNAARAFGTAALPRTSLLQLLSILHRLARHSNALADAIVAAPSLISNLLRTLVLTSTASSSSAHDEQPTPEAIDLLMTLVLASRANARALVGPADALLRFVVAPIPADIELAFGSESTYPYPYSSTLALELMGAAIRLYAAMAAYGVYSSVATTAAEPLARIGKYVSLSLTLAVRRPGGVAGARLRVAYLQAVEAWTVCAVDPHRTTPEHEILWSQVIGWGWAEEAIEMRGRLVGQSDGEGGDEQEAEEIWTALWRVQAAWLEGARVNGVRGGEGERAVVVDAFKDGFESGKEKAVLARAIEGLQDMLDMLGTSASATTQTEQEEEERMVRLRTMAQHANTIVAALRLWLACLPPLSSTPLPSPPLQLPFRRLSTLASTVVAHPLLASIYIQHAPSYLQVSCRPLTAFLASFVRMSRRMPTTPDALWLAQASAVLVRLVPGDEDVARSIIGGVVKVVTEDFMRGSGRATPSVVWERGGMSTIEPFLTFGLRPLKEVHAHGHGDGDGDAEGGGESGSGKTEREHVAPVVPTPRSIQLATTQRLPPAWAIRRRTHSSASGSTSTSLGLPLARDWPLAALDHVLRSGTSPAWHVLPDAWNASEVEVVRASLLLGSVVRNALGAHGLGGAGLGMSRAEVVFGCMKVFMLEHGQNQAAAADEGKVDGDGEVFRDPAVGVLMEDLLAPCTLHNSPDGLSVSPSSTFDASDDLEAASARFLGPGTPFYQFYTDFVALYDSISFAHPLFAALLLPPLMRRYPADYRKALLGDAAHILGTVRTPVERAIGARVGEYLWPAEESAEVVGAYLGVLVGGRQAQGLEGRGRAEGFVRWLAVHHVAANIWPDLHVDGDAGLVMGADAGHGRERARKLLEAVVGQGAPDVVQEVVMYWQRREGSAVMAPECFALLEERRVARAEWVARWGTERTRERLAGLLAP